MFLERLQEDERDAFWSPAGRAPMSAWRSPHGRVLRLPEAPRFVGVQAPIRHTLIPARTSHNAEDVERGARDITQFHREPSDIGAAHHLRRFVEVAPCELTCPCAISAARVDAVGVAGDLAIEGVEIHGAERTVLGDAVVLVPPYVRPYGTNAITALLS